MPTTQIQLFPERRLASVPSFVLIDAVEESDAVPSDELVDSVARFGILQPVALIERGRTPAARAFASAYMIADGRRRVAAARRNNFQSIPALIFPPETPRHVAAAIAVTANLQRASNPINELEEIEVMVREGASFEEIASQLRIPLRTIYRRMRLASLIDELRAALRDGLLSTNAAEAATRLSVQDQQRVVRWIEEGRRVTPRMIREELAGSAAAGEALVAAVDPDAPAVDEAESAGVRAAAGPAEVQPVELTVDGVQGWPAIYRAVTAALGALPSADRYAEDAAVLIEDIQFTLAEVVEMIQPFLEDEV